MDDPYERLRKRVKRIWNLDSVSQILTWDQEVMMPEEGVEARSQQQSALNGVTHRLVAADDLGDLIEAAAGEVDDPEKRAVVREVRRRHRRAAPVPIELVERMSAASSTAVDVWKDARQEDDFERFAPHLEEIVELQREYAAKIDPDREPYRVLFEDYEPYLDFSTMERILDRLREELPPLLEEIAASDVDLATETLRGEFPEAEQAAVVRDLVDRLGFDFDRGRLDASTHPVTFGNQFDARITDRYDPENLEEGLLAGVHECGHALYQLGLPKEDYGTPLGSARELSIHESQSRFWENHVARSEAFWEFMLPRLREAFPDQFGDATPRDAFEAANQVYDDNPIRIRADELTYHLHILVRFELERDLVNGEIEVEELPERWDEKMERYLGIRPETDREGVLQDIHWSWGAFGYFPTYTLGSVIAAQLAAAIEEDVGDLDAEVADGDFGPLRDWLRSEIHRHGQRYTTSELVERATGKAVTADHFLDHIEEKYGRLYDL